MDYIAAYEPIGVEIEEGEVSSNQDTHASVDYDDTAPPYETVTSQLDIEELLLSSQRLLNSVQKTLDESNLPTQVAEEATIATAVDCKAFECSRGIGQASHHHHQRRIPEACVRQWAKELIVAVDALHSKKIMLGHLDAHNLLLGKNGQLLLTYYHYRDYSDAISKHSFTEGSFPMAPDRPPRMESDWYSVGVVLYELLTGHLFIDHHPGRWCYFDLQFPDSMPPTSAAAASLLQGVSVPFTILVIMLYWFG